MFRVGSLALLLALTATLPPAQRLAAQEDLLETVSAIEQSLWQGWADRDATAFREHIVDNHVQIGGGGITAGRAQVIPAMEGDVCQVESFALSNFALHRLSEDALILSYESEQDAVCDGEPLDEHVISAAVYVRVDGRWMSASYQETPRRM
jgi:hypothetical protein